MLIKNNTSRPIMIGDDRVYPEDDYEIEEKGFDSCRVKSDLGDIAITSVENLRTFKRTGKLFAREINEMDSQGRPVISIEKQICMHKWTEEELIAQGYKIQNAKITSVDLSMADHGCLVLRMVLDGGGWGVAYGGYCLGHGYVGAKDDYFDGSADGMESVIRIMDTVGCECFNDMKGKHIRVATKGLSSPVKIIGNIIKDQWFDYGTFFKE